jgi:hypothetical protein
MLTCTRCGGSGFLNLHQIDESYGMDVPDMTDEDSILAWIRSHENHDVQICDCCGDGEGWYETPGEHYGQDDPMGHDGPYAYNGGLCECH